MAWGFDQVRHRDTVERPESSTGNLDGGQTDQVLPRFARGGLVPWRNPMTPVSNPQELIDPSENPVRRRLREGKPVIGVTLSVNHVETAAQVASMGFDFLWVEMEHSPIGLDTLRQIVLATRGLQAVPFARVPVNALWTAKRVLDAGVLGVIFPFTSTPELARQAAQACRYPPLGRRGSGAGLATFRWPAAEGYHDWADRNVVSVAVIEEESAVEQIGEIASTPELDVLFVGPSDLAFSMGLRGDMAHPRVTAAMRRVMEVARAHGKYAGRVATSPDDIRRAVDQGFQFLQTGTELNLMAAGARELLGPLGRWQEPDQARPLY
jgi:2-keto-3-deoxy-L-rhamnonate aldolase RhmA